MKKLLFAVFAIAVLFSACSKEKKLNKSLDGTWNLLTVNGQALMSGEVITWKFEKDKKGKGTYTYTYATNGVTTLTKSGSYELDKDDKIAMPSVSVPTADVYTIESYSDSDLTIKNNQGSISVLKKQ